MNGSLRLATAEDLLPLLPAGYVSAATLLDGREGGSNPGDEQLRLELGRLVDEILHGAEVEPGCVATVPIHLTSRSFDRQQVAWLLGVLKHIRSVFAVREAAAYQLDVILLLHNLWEETRDALEARRATRECVQGLTTALAEHDGVSPRLWLLDGQASDGRIFTIHDLSPVVKQFDPQSLPTNLLARAAATSVYSFGARSVWFPRDQVLEYLGTRCVGQVFEHETWIDGATIPYATVASECADFIQVGVGPIVAEMDFDPATRQRIIPEVRCPSLDGDKPVQATLDEMRKVVDDLERSQLEGVQRRLVENRHTAVERLKAALKERVDRQLDERDERVAMSLAFLELITTSSASAAGGDRIDMGRPWTLRQAFADAFAFFDEVVGYDTSLRELVTRLQQRLDELRRNIDVCQGERRVIEKRIAEDDEASEDELKDLDDRIKDIEEEIEATREQLQEARKAVKAQDWEIIDRREEIGKQLVARVGEEVSAAGDRVGERAAETDDARTALQQAEKALKDSRSGTVSAIVFVAALLVIIGFLVSWLVPPLFHAGTRAPYLWLIHTGVGWWMFNIWAAVTLVLVLIVVWGSASTIRRLRREMEERRRQLEVCRTSLLAALAAYWDAYSKRFTSRCEWIRCAHVFDTNRELEVFIDELHDQLEAFLEDLREARDAARERAGDFQLRGTLTEDIVIGMDWVEDLRASKSRVADQLAREFLKEERHRLSRYFAAGAARVDVFESDIQGECAKRVFPEVESTTVIQAMRDGATFDVGRTAMSLAVFLPLKLATRVDTVLVVQGPGPEETLARCVESLAPLPALIVSDDDERMLLLRIAHDVDLKNVTILHDEVGGPRSRSIE